MKKTICYALAAVLALGMIIPTYATAGDSIYVPSIEGQEEPGTKKITEGDKEYDLIVTDNQGQIEDELYHLELTNYDDADKKLTEERIDLMAQALSSIKGAEKVSDIVPDVEDTESDLVFNNLFDVSIIYDNGDVKTLSDGEKAKIQFDTNFSQTEKVYFVQFTEAGEWVMIPFEIQDDGSVIVEITSAGPVAIVAESRNHDSPQTSDSSVMLVASCTVLAGVCAVVLNNKKKH